MAGIAHEINTPTQYVRDNVEFVSKAQSMIASLFDAACALADTAEAHDATREAARAACSTSEAMEERNPRGYGPGRTAGIYIFIIHESAREAGAWIY